MRKIFDNSYFWGLVVFIAAGFFRLLFLDLMESKPDQVLNIYEIIQFYQSPYWIGRSNAPVTPGIYWFPLSHYLFLLFALPSRNPLSIAFMIALLNTVSIVFFYWWSRKFYGNTVAIIAALFLSLSPWSIMRSRTIYVPDLMLPFSIFFLYFAHKVILKKDKKSFFWYGFSAALFIQIHPPGLFILIATSLFILIKKIRISFQKVSLGLVAGFVFAIPYIVSFIIPYQNFPWVVQIAKELRFAASFQLIHLIFPFQFITGFGFNSYIGKNWANFLDMFPYIRYFDWLFVLEMLLQTVSLYYILKKKKELLFLWFILITTTLFYVITRSQPNLYYDSSISPIVAILEALAIVYLINLSPKILKKITPALLFLLFLTHIVFEGSFYAFLNQKEEIGGDYNWIYRKAKNFAKMNTKQYSRRDNYNSISAVALVYTTQPDIFHQRMGEYFAQTGEPYLAMDEYKKQLIKDPKNVQTLGNLIYISILSKDFSQVEKELKFLEVLNTTAAADLKKILNQTRGEKNNQINK